MARRSYHGAGRQRRFGLHGWIVRARRGARGTRVDPVRAWKIWNEENTPTFWSWQDTGGVSAASYRDALQGAHQALRSVDPDARVVLGGLTDFPSSHPNNALDFLGAVTKMAQGECLYDAVAIHPYSDTVQIAVSRVQDTRNKLDNLGMNDVDIWITELGWAVAGDWQKNAQGVVEQTPFTVADETQQANYVQAFANAMDNHRQDWGIGPTIWFNYQDLTGDHPGDKQWDFHCGFMELVEQYQPTVPRKPWQTATQIASQTKHVALPKLRCGGSGK